METRVALFVVALSLMVAMALAKPGTPTLKVTPVVDPVNVDVGITVTFTCEENTADTKTPTVWEFYVAGTKTTDGVNKDVYTPPTATAGAAKEIKCKTGDGADLSDAFSNTKTLTITALKAPTLTSSITASGTTVTVANGFPVKFTCAKTGKQEPKVGYKFYDGSTEITSSTTGAAIAGGELTVTASNAWKGKVIKCTHVNTDTLKKESATLTLAVTMVPDKPTIEFTSSLKEGDELMVTCKKTGDIVVTEFEIEKDGTKVESTGTLKAEYKAKVTKADNDKKFRCRAKNTVGTLYSVYSEEQTLEVKAGAASQLVSMTTMALVLALGAFFKE